MDAGEQPAGFGFFFVFFFCVGSIHLFREAAKCTYRAYPYSHTLFANFGAGRRCHVNGRRDGCEQSVWSGRNRMEINGRSIEPALIADSAVSSGDFVDTGRKFHLVRI